MSSNRLKESESNYSIKRAGESTLERNKTTNGAKSVLFATENNTFSSPSSSSYSISEQLKVSRNHLNNSTGSTTSTSQLIKQTLSPLSLHRNIQQSTVTGTNVTNSTIDMKLNHRTNYQFPLSSSSQLNSSGKISTNSKSNHTDDIKLSSPSKSSLGNNYTNTLPSNLARNMLYQSESNYSNKNQLASITSSGNSISNTSSTMITNNTIYGTLPKSLNTHGTGNSTNGETGTGTAFGSVSAVANEFEQIIARNATNQSYSFNTHATHNSIGTGNYNTLGSYRVQYSATNPFLQHLEPQTSESGTSNGDK